MLTLLDLSSDLLDLVFSSIHANDLQSLKRTNSCFNFMHPCCDCKSKRLDELNI